MTSRICDVLVAIQKRGIFLETYVLVVASNAPVYTGACLLVADRPQAPVRTGANAPVLLSRLRRLLLPAGREKIITAPPAGGHDFSLSPSRPKSAPRCFWR